LSFKAKTVSCFAIRIGWYNWKYRTERAAIISTVCRLGLGGYHIGIVVNIEE